VFAEKSPVHADDCEREKNGHLSNNINAENVWTGKNPETAPSSQIDGYPELPECLPRTPIRGVPPDRRPALGPPDDSSVRGVPPDRRPALGPPDDSSDDFQ